MTRVVVVGASGNVGSQLLDRLSREPAVDEVVGISRREPPAAALRAQRWISCDIGESDSTGTLTQACRGADAVVHLAWQIQPGRDIERLHRTNVDGSRRVFAAAVAAKVPAIVYVSSVGTYSAGPKDAPVDESWRTDGIPTSTYARHKAAVERELDRVEQANPQLRVVRLRPGLIFQRDAASEISRYFLGPFVPLAALRRSLVPVIPTFDRLAFQAVHTADVATALAQAVLDESVSGAFNLAADPVLDAATLAEALHARQVPVPFTALRLAADAAFRLRLVPTDAGWLDMAAAVPVMSSERARTILGWEPTHTATDALLELLDGFHHGAGRSLPPLLRAPNPAGRVAEMVRTAVRGGPGAENP